MPCKEQTGKKKKLQATLASNFPLLNIHVTMIYNEQNKRKNQFLENSIDTDSTVSQVLGSCTQHVQTIQTMHIFLFTR